MVGHLRRTNDLLFSAFALTGSETDQIRYYRLCLPPLLLSIDLGERIPYTSRLTLSTLLLSIECEDRRADN